MNNYVYIIAGLPDFTPDWRQGEKSLDEYLDQVRELLSEKDNKVLDFIVKGFDKDQIGPELYKEALAHRLGFIREFFQFDLNVRNQKVRYLNQALGRDPEKDIMSLRDPEAEEQDCCIEWLRAQTRIIRPQIIVCLGRIAAQKLISKDFKVTRQHGEFIRKGNILFMGTFHPAALLRNPANKPDTLSDFQNLRDKIKELNIQM